MALKYKLFYSKKFNRLFSTIVLNEVQINKFKDDMFCPNCKVGKLYFRPNHKTPNLVHNNAFPHKEGCDSQVKYFDVSDFTSLSEENIKKMLMDNFNIINKIDNLEGLSLKTYTNSNQEKKVQIVIILDDLFSKKIEYDCDFFIVGENIKINKHLINKEDKDKKEYDKYRNFITLRYNEKYLLGVGFTNKIKKKIFPIIVNEDKLYNVALFGKIISQENGKFRKVQIIDPKFIEIW